MLNTNFYNSPYCQRFIHTYYDISFSDMANLIPVADSYFRRLRKQRNHTDEIKFSLLLKSLERKINSGLGDASQLATSQKKSILRAKNFEQIEEDTDDLEKIIDNEAYKKDASLHHLYAFCLSTLWMAWKVFGADISQKRRDVSSLIHAKKHWEQSLLHTSCNVMEAYIKHNLASVEFLIDIYSLKTSDGKFVDNPYGKAEEHADEKYFNAFKESAKVTNNIHGWRDAVEMAVYLKSSSLIEDALDGFKTCLDSKVLSDQSILIAIDILKAIDNASVLEGYEKFREICVNEQ